MVGIHRLTRLHLHNYLIQGRAGRAYVMMPEGGLESLVRIQHYPYCVDSLQVFEDLPWTSLFVLIESGGVQTEAKCIIVVGQSQVRMRMAHALFDPRSVLHDYCMLVIPATCWDDHEKK